MRKTLVLGLMLLSSAVWMHAQYSQSQSPGAVPTKDWVQGCLATVRGHYVVTDKDGKTLELSGAANKLKNLVGHEIKATGTPGTRTSDTTVQGSASSAVEIPVLRVKTVTDISKGCQ